MLKQIRQKMFELPACLQIHFKGRINRQRFILYYLAILILYSFAFFIYSLAPEPFRKAFDTSFLFAVALWLTYTFILLYTFFYIISITIRRLHDLERSTWLVLLTLIPITFILLTIYLVIFKGTDGSNKYGKDPLQYETYGKYLETLR